MTDGGLVEWLLEQIADDEAVARSAIRFADNNGEEDEDPGDHWEAHDYSVWTERQPVVTAPGGLWEPSAVMAHIARHDPATVLRECAAKRQIIASVSGWRHAVVEDCWYTCAAATEERDGGECCADGRRGGVCDCGRDSRVLAILTPLASAYADRPGYRQEWAL